MLRQVYDDVKKNYYDPKYRGTDLAANYQKYYAMVDQAQTNSAGFRVIAAFLGTLQDSHTYFVPPQRANPSTSGFTMEMVGDKCFVTRIRPGSDAASKLNVGDQVLTFDGFNVRRIDFEKMHYFLEVLTPSVSQGLTVESVAGEQRQVVVKSMIRTGKKEIDLTSDNDFWNVMREADGEEQLNRERLFETGDVLIWKMPSFEVTPGTIDSAFSKVRKHKALVLDLRGNPGGNVDALKEMISNVFNRPVTLTTEVTRKGSKADVVKPRGDSFEGKLIVLIDSQSASAAELFARVVQLEHRGNVIGDQSAGAVMEARYFPESLGLDTKVFYGVSVTYADLLMSDGKSLEDVGVKPDEVMLPTAEDIAANRDPVLSHAAELAGMKLDPAGAAKLFPPEWPPL